MSDFEENDPTWSEYTRSLGKVKAITNDTVDKSAALKLAQKVRAHESLPDTMQSKQSHASFAFSDMFRAQLPSEGPLRYRRDDVPAHTLKRLRRGEFYPELILDLHGLTKEQSKLELAALIDSAYRQLIDCVSVMHGIGSGILREALPHYLVQHPYVRAFHQAPLEYGGNGALVILLDSKEDIRRD